MAALRKAPVAPTRLEPAGLPEPSIPDQLQPGPKNRMLRHHGEQTMRYVIGICIVAGFLIWDVGYNEGRYISSAVMELKRLTEMVGA